MAYENESGLTEIDVVLEGNDSLAVVGSGKVEVNSKIRPELNDLNLYEKVKLASTYVLEDRKCNDASKAMASSSLLEEVKKEFPEHFSNGIAKNTFYQYLSNSVRDESSLINCLGRRQGYYISEVAKKVIDSMQHKVGYESTSQDSDNISVSSRRVQREQLLYPLLKTWLRSEGYQANDISAGRSLGKWGNPDVAGISVIDAFSGSSIELVTIEAKAALENWEQWIFEAVSHRRFANRAYFAFAAPEDMAAKVPKEMRYYSELYGIGVLMVVLDNEAYNEYVSGALTSLLEKDCEVVEVFSAPFNFVQPKYQIQFCEAYGINGLKKLYMWGKSDNGD